MRAGYGVSIGSVLLWWGELGVFRNEVVKEE